MATFAYLPNLARRRGVAAAIGVGLMSVLVTTVNPAKAADLLTLTGFGNLRVSQPPPFDTPTAGCETYKVPSRNGVQVIVRDGRVTVIEVRTSGVSTASGVAVGQGAFRVPAVYGKSVQEAGSGYIYVPSGSDASLRMTFEIRNGKVIAIQTGEGPDVLGGCKGGDRLRAQQFGSESKVDPVPAPSSVPRNSSASAAKKVVVVDPGHNGENGSHPREINKLVDAGGFTKACNTTGTTGLTGLTEASFNWEVARKLAAVLDAHGWQVILTRSDNTGWGPCVNERGLTAQRNGAVALLSVHADGGPASGHGFHVIWPKAIPGYTERTASASGELAVSVRNALVAAGLTTSTYIGRRGLDNRSDLGTLNLSAAPSMMVESGNMRNTGDDQFLSSADGQQRIAEGIAAGFEAWYAAR